MLDVTKDDIKNLNDSDLRILVGKLCEAQLYEIGNDTCCVSYGGNQDEKDNGIDVKVNATKVTDTRSFIPMNNTIFQVKKPKMSPGEIKREMRTKKGYLRDSIKNLAEINGAYIIVSGMADTTDITYSSRIKCMKEILKEEKLENTILVDFYDSNKIATWVNKYPSLICWVNDKNGKNTNGWCTYHNWSNKSEEEQPFIMDEESVIYRNDFSKENQIRLVDGINEIRNTLLIPKSSIRLAGLSGVGKTRLAQALFDNTIGNNPLNKEMVIYGDIGDSLQPDPITFIQRLQTLDKRVILIVDNCEATMHNKLTELCQRHNSKISLMTIEYDVKEDDNVDSNNYYLSTTSDGVLKQLIKRKFKNISDINVDTIVKCSDGNFRIALYLSKSISTQKNIGVLNYDELFNRLFFQGIEIDKELLKVGEACSLFYSFDISYDVEDEKNELNIISDLISISAINVLGKVEELRCRQIVQKRGNMRAILPHALANKLAIDCLKKIPAEHIMRLISKNERLCISFFRRLKFLHSSDEAQVIAKKYFYSLSDEDLIDAKESLMEKIKCITILNPELVLQRIENITEQSFFTRNNKQFYEWVRIFGYIAFDEKTFKRAIELIIKIAQTEKTNENYNSVRDVLYNFFHIYLSSTHAKLSVRLEVISELLQSSKKDRKEIGLKLIDEILHYGSFFASPLLDCGSQIRDYGLEPNGKDWYEEALSYCRNFLYHDICYEDIKEILAFNFRNLASIGFYDILETIVEENIIIKSWPRIWISLLAIKHFDSERISRELMNRIDKLIDKVQPVTISDKVTAFFNKHAKIYLGLEDITDNDKQINDIIYNLGKEIGLDKENFESNILLFDDTCSLYRVSFFTKGLYENFKDKDELIYILLDKINESNEHIFKEILSNLVGLYYKENQEECSNLLDRIVEDPKYNKNYLYLQLSYQLSSIDIRRIEKTIELGAFNENDLGKIEWYLMELSTDEVTRFFDTLPNTTIVQSTVLMSLFEITRRNKVDELLMSYIRKRLTLLDYSQLDNVRNNHDEYIISELIKSSFSKEAGIIEARIIFQHINSLISEKYVTFYSYKGILIPLIKLYPKEFLNIFIDYKEKPNWEKIYFFRRSFNLNPNVLSYIEDSKLIEWIKENKRIQELSYIMEPYVFDKEKGYYVWSELGKYVIENYYNNNVVMKNIIANVYPNSWSGEYSEVLKERENLFLQMKNNNNPIITNIGKKEHYIILKKIDVCCINEKNEREERFNRFE